MKFVGENGKIFDFSFTTASLYLPNLSSTSGYGSDDWFFVCYINTTYYLLHFEVSGSCGGSWWELKEIKKEDADILPSSTKEKWWNVWYDTNKPCIRHIHPENLVEAENIVVPKCSRLGPLTYEILKG